MERKKFTTTLSEDTIRMLKILKAVEDLNGANDVIELLVKERFKGTDWEGISNGDKSKED